MQEPLRNIFGSKIKQLKKKDGLLKNALVNVQKRKKLFKKGLKKIAKMQNLVKMRGLSRDELEQNARIRRIKNYEDMKKEYLI